MNEIERAQLCSTASSCLRHGTGELVNLPALIAKIIDEKAWERRKIKTGEIVELGSLAELITEPPLKGWGESVEMVEKLLEDAETLADFRKATKGKGNQWRVDNITPAKQKGTSKAYLAERLKRDHPDEFQKLKEGAHKSVRAAAIAAGIVKIKTPLEVAQSAVGRLSGKELKTLIKWMEELA